MRQKSSNSSTATITRPRRDRSSRLRNRDVVVGSDLRTSSTGMASGMGSSLAKSPSGITITPLRGFFMALLFLGVPTVSLGSICFSLLQNNLRLSERNEELAEMATEVKADIDSLDAEIESLRARAGVSKDKEDDGASVEPEALPASSADTEEADSQKVSRRSQKSKKALSSSSLVDTPTRSSSLGFPVHKDSDVARNFSPQGGPSQKARALALLQDAKAQVPELNKALDSAIKPALEKTLAEEAAYPNGQPVVGKVELSSRFGIRSNPFGGGSYEVHEGLDFVGEQGDIIAATGDGKVTLAGHNGGYGITVTIDHGYGYETLYAHMSEMRVNVGDTVKRGQIIGYIGSTGRSSGPHLHYSVYKEKVAIDPEKVMVLPTNEMAVGPR